MVDILSKVYLLASHQPKHQPPASTGRVSQVQGVDARGLKRALFSLPFRARWHCPRFGRLFRHSFALRSLGIGFRLYEARKPSPLADSIRYSPGRENRKKRTVKPLRTKEQPQCHSDPRQPECAIADLKPFFIIPNKSRNVHHINR